MKKLLLILLLSLLFFSSCGGDSSGGDDDGGTGDSLTSITISVVEDPVICGIDNFYFRVRGNDGLAYTSQSQFYVNDEAISSSNFSPVVGGAYSVYATKGDLTSNTITVTATTIDLTVTSDRSTTYVELEPFVFTATGSNGVDYTNRAVFYVNDIEIDGHVFDPEDAGDYQVHAIIGDNIIVSTDITVSATVGYESLTITADKAGYVVGQTAVFTAIDNIDRNLTNNAEFKVNGTVITGNTYDITSVGNYTITATYEGIESDILSFDAVTATHTTKVLVEDYTGTTCGYCTRVAYKLEYAVNQNSNIIPIAVHGAFSGTTDPYYYSELDLMASTLGFSAGSAPQAYYNRTEEWEEYNYNTAGAAAVLNEVQLENKGLGLAINSTKTGDNLSIEVRVGFDIPYSNDINLVVVLLENGLIHSQTNYYQDQYYEGPNPIPDFVHNAVIRKAYDEIFGESIPLSEAVANSVYTKNMDVTIPADVENTDNLTLVAFVIDANTNTVINAQKADVGVNQDFD